MRALLFALLFAASGPSVGLGQDVAEARTGTSAGRRPTVTVFEGPLYGAEVVYSSDWQVVGSGVHGEADVLHLDNGTSKVSVVVGTGFETMEECANRTAMLFSEIVPSLQDVQLQLTFVDKDNMYGARYESASSQLLLTVVCMDFGHPKADIAYTSLVHRADSEAQGWVSAKILGSVMSRNGIGA